MEDSIRGFFVFFSGKGKVNVSVLSRSGLREILKGDAPHRTLQGKVTRKSPNVWKLSDRLPHSPRVEEVITKEVGKCFKLNNNERLGTAMLRAAKAAIKEQFIALKMHLPRETMEKPGSKHPSLEFRERTTNET